MIRGDFQMKQDLYRPEGVELRIPVGHFRSFSRRSAKRRFIAVGGAAIGGVYLLTQLSAVAGLVIGVGALLLLLAGLVAVAAWGLDNSPW